MSTTTGIVNYVPESEVPARKSSRCFDKIRLIPGRNKIETSKIQELKKHPLFNHYVSIGAVQIITEEVPPEVEITGLNTLKIDVAIALVNDETSLVKLNKWHEIESAGKKRAPVLNAIALKIKDVEGGKL